MARIPKNGDWSEMVQESENPNGLISQTANGTIVNSRGGDGEQSRYPMADGARWNSDPRINPEPFGMPVEVLVPTLRRKR